MGFKSFLFQTIIRSIVVLAFVGLTMADAGVFTGNGQNLHQISSKSVQLVSIDVTIVPGRGPFLFDGTVPGMDETQFYCTFVLKNLSDHQEDVQIGFPVDSQFARRQPKESPSLSAKESQQWVSEYSFMAGDETKTYHVAFVHRKRDDGPGKFSEIFTWSMIFAPKETRTLKVQYRIPMSMGLTSTRKDESSRQMRSGSLDQELLNIATEELVGYITSTGSSWAGNVGSATFTVITEPFERYLDARGLEEGSPSDKGLEQDEDAARIEANFPVRHPWWFRSISPSGWQKVEHGVKWSYKDYKPEDPIVISYYMTEIPRLAEEVPPFVDVFLKNLSARGPYSPREQLQGILEPGKKRDLDKNMALQPAVELQRLKQFILATYGQEPEDQAVKQYVASQIWYEPRKDFSIENLTKAQKAVLHELDIQIANAQSLRDSSKN